MPPCCDLHTHSTCSDGVLSPGDLVDHAARQGVDCLALTDHDSVAGLDAAQARAVQRGLHFVAGVEISVTWRARTIHVVGLAVDPCCPSLIRGLAAQQALRRDRAEAIHKRLQALNIDITERVDELALGAVPTRTHFARALVAGEHAGNMKKAFRRYLAIGRPAYVSIQWADFETAIGWILAAGGRAVLAHPLRYKLTRFGRQRLIEAFREAGGSGIEMAPVDAGTGRVHEIVSAAKRFQLLASSGSDYHGPKLSWHDLGQVPAVPCELTPVWHDWHLSPGHT